MSFVWGMLAIAAPAWAQDIGTAQKASSVSMRELAGKPESTQPAKRFIAGHKRFQKDPENLPVNTTTRPQKTDTLATPQSITGLEPQTLPEPSPAPSSSFGALLDNGVVAPPDTFGAVGPNHLVVACASDLRVMTRAGAVLSTQSQEQFWSGVASNIFDTRVVYDPYGQRFIMTAAGDPAGRNPRLCIAVTAGTNPNGTWYRWSEDVDAVNPYYVDSPTLGFNKTWIVVQANVYRKDNFAFVRSDVYAYNKSNLYGNGTGQRTRLPFAAEMGASQVPATMYDPTIAVVYFVKNWNGRVVNTDGTTDGYLRLFSLSGGIGSEKLNVTNSSGLPVFAIVPTTWAEIAPGNVDILPQLGSTAKIHAGDSRIQNVHFRDGLLYAAHTIFLPGSAPNRAAAQWWMITAGTGEVIHYGRLDDPSGIGETMYAYPSIAANRYNDVLVGYSRFSSDAYPSAAYSFRQLTDGLFDLRGEVTLKAGETNYNVPIFGQNRWGDWSAATVDPLNDVDLWTIQEYAAPHVDGGSRWGTWWGRVSPPNDLAITSSDAPDPVPSGNQITYTLVVTNKLEKIVSSIRVEDTLPAGAAYVSSTSTKGSCSHSSGVVICDLSQLAEFETATITITVVAGPPGFATNSAVVSAGGPDVFPSDNTTTAVTEIQNSADLQVQGADSPDPVHTGNTLTYTLSIFNAGPSAAAGVVMTSTLPASVTIGTITASQGTWTNSGNEISFTFGSINNQGAAQIAISCTPNVGGGTITNQVRVAANTYDPNLANNLVNIPTRVNARPVISQLGTQTINEDVATSIPITISDAETAANALQLSAVSSNQGLIPNSNIVPGGSGQNRTLTITSAPNQFGSNTTTITVTVTDGDGASSVMTFPINVAAVNDAPTIASIPNPPGINEDTSASITVNIGDIDSPLSALTLSANTSNGTLLPVSNISFSPSGSSRTVTLTPATNRSGSVTVTIIVSDGSLTASSSFVLTVLAVNDPPTVSSIDPQTTPEDTQTPNITFTVDDPETAATNLAVTATSSDTTLVPNGNITLVNLGSTRRIRLNPAADQNGVTLITVRVSDGTDAVTTTFELTVTPVNDRPTLVQPSNLTISEDGGPINVTLTGIGSGAANENQTLSLRASTTTPDLVENLQINYTSPNTTGTLSFGLVPDANGTALIDVTVSDGVPADDLTRQFQVTITAVNDPPTIDPIDNVTVLEDSGQTSITLTGLGPGAANEVNQTITITAVSSATSIVPNPQISYVSGASTAALRFTPAANAFGSATITVTVDDGRAQNPITTRTFQITVEPVNDFPTMGPHLGDRTINEDASLGPVSFHFRDVEPGVLTVTATSSSQSLVPDGNIVITGTGTNRSMTITPLPNEFGATFITVRVSDSEGGSTNQTFLLTVNPLNDPPTLAGIPNPAPIDEDAPAQTVGLSGISAGPANESSQVVTITAASSNPSVIPHPTVNYTSPSTVGSLTYTPAANATGSAVITVTANDGQSANNIVTQTFTVQINPVNDPPTISGDFEDKFIDEDVPLVISNVVVGDVETAAGSLTLRGGSSNLELVEESGITFGGSGAIRTITVRPLTNAAGAAAFISIFVRDGDGAETEVGFQLFVNEVDDPPLIAAPSGQTIAEDTSTAFNVWVNDVDTPLASVSLVGRSSNQQLAPDANVVITGSGTNRTVSITPLPDAHGSATISLTASDGTSSSTAQVSLTVNSVNDPPVFDSIPDMNLLEDAGLQVVTLTGVSPGAANETSDVLTVSAVSSLPSLVPNPVGTNDNGTLKLFFTPAANSNGTATITVTVSDGRPVNSTSSRTFTVNVQALNDPPTLNGIANQSVNEDAPPQNITLTGIGPGPGETGVLTFVASSSNPALIPHPTISYTNGSSTAVLRFTVTPNAAGTAIITVRVSDGAAETIRDFTVTVNSVNEPPFVITGITSTNTLEDVPLSVPITIGDEETYAALLTLSATSTNTTLVPNANITFNGADSNRWVTITPAANQFGNTRIVITVSDGTNNVTTAFNVTVTSVNDLPNLGALPNLSLSQNPPNQTISLTGINAGAANENQTLSIQVTSSNPTLVPAPSSVSYTSPNPTGSFVLNPANSGNGIAVITVTVSETSPSASFSRSFTVYIRPSGNALPTLNVASTGTTAEDTPITVPVTVGDAETAASDLILGALSSNAALVPTNNILFTGTGNNRSMTITPHADRSGSSTITVWVLDSQFGYTQSNFVLQVTAVNDAPFISPIPNQSVLAGTNMPPVPFTIGDAETPAQNLALAATSSNQGLLPNGNIVFGGAGTNRSVMAYPLAGQTGSANITVTVTDGSAAPASTTFTLAVLPAQPPRLAIRLAGSNVELLWPTQAGAYGLQGRDQLGSGNWTDIVSSPTVSGTNNVVTQPRTGPYKFFRLRN